MRIRIEYFIALSLTIVSFAPCMVHAQGPSAKAEEDTRKSQYDSPANTTYSFDYMANAVRPPKLRLYSDDPDKFTCDDGEGKGCVGKNIVDPRPARFDTDTVWYPAMIGQNKAINSVAIANQTNSNLTAVNSLLRTTWTMVEPAVAAANYNAVMEAQMALLNRYMQDIHYMQQLGLQPQTNQQMGMGYFACISEKIEKAKKDPKTGKTKTETFFAAQAECSGDTGANPLISSSSDFNEAKDGALTSAKKFNFASDLNWEPLQHVTDPDSQVRIMPLSNYIFSQENYWESWLGTPKVINDLRNEFITYAGDIHFAMQADVDENGVDFPVEGYRRVTVQRLHPPYNPSGKGPLPYSPEQLYQMKVTEAYNAIAIIVQLYCAFQQTELSNLTVQDVPSLRLKPEQGNFWQTPPWKDITKDYLIKASMRGYMITPVLVRGLYQSFLLEHGDKKLDDLQCSKLDPYGPETKLQNAAKEPDKKAPERVKFYFFLAQRIALGQQLGIYMNLEKFVNRLTSGGFNDTVKRYARQLLHDAAGTEDPEGAYAINLADTIQFTDDLMKYIDAQVAKGGVPLQNRDSRNPFQISDIGTGSN